MNLITLVALVTLVTLVTLNILIMMLSPLSPWSPPSPRLSQSFWSKYRGLSMQWSDMPSITWPSLQALGCSRETDGLVEMLVQGKILE